MPVSKKGFAKSLKGFDSRGLTVAEIQADSITAGTIVTGGFSGDIVFEGTLSDVDIDSGTIDGVVIGGDEPPVITSSTLTVGSNGTGFPVNFFCDTVDKRMFWDDTACKLTVFGSFRVTDTTESLELGDFIKIDAGEHNTLKTSTGNLILSPAGTLVLTTAIDSDTAGGDITFNTTGGLVDIHGQTSATLRSTDGNVIITAANSTADVNITAGSSGDINLTANSTNITGDLTVSGLTTTTIQSTTVTITDPVLTLGANNAGNDLLDRGISFKWHDGATAFLGFMGYDESLGKFVLHKKTTETSANVFCC